MLIVEGADCVGKTTLCKALLCEYDLQSQGYVYSHFTRLPRGFDYYWGYVERMSRRIVQDRFHLSEIVYTQVRGEESPLTSELYRLVGAKLRLLGAYTVVITAAPDLIKERWEGGQQMYSLENVLKANELFSRAWEYQGEMGLDLDFLVECNDGQPFPHSAAVDEIVQGYLKRQQELDRVLQRLRRTL